MDAAKRRGVDRSTHERSDVTILNIFPAVSSRAYYTEELPSAHDDAIVVVLRMVAAGSAGEAQRIRQEMTEPQAWLLIAFASRMASLAVRERSRSRLDDALTALVFEGGVLGYA